MLRPICARRRFSRTPFEPRAPIESLESRLLLSYTEPAIKMAYIIARYPAPDVEHTVAQSVEQARDNLRWVNDFITRTSFGAVHVPAEPGAGSLVTEITLPFGYDHYFNASTTQPQLLHAHARAAVFGDPLVDPDALQRENNYAVISVRFNGIANAQGASQTIGRTGSSWTTTRER